MPLPLVEFAKYDASLSESSDGFSIHSASGDVFGVIQRSPDPAAFQTEKHLHEPVPSLAVQHAVNALLYFDHAQLGVQNNRRLSVDGKLEDLEPIKDNAIKMFGGSVHMFEEHRVRINAEETQRYAVRPLDRTDFAGHMFGREIRDFVRDLHRRSAEKSAKHPKKEGDPEVIAFNNQLTDGSDPELMLAVLRSPIKIGNIEQMALRGWKEMIDRNDREGAERLKLAKSTNDWADAWLGAARARIIKKFGYSKDQLFAKTNPLKYAPYFGFSPGEILRFDRSQNPRREI